MFSRLTIQNFRAIGSKPISVDLAPVTVLVGENGSGKSSVLQALALTAQSATERENRTDLILAGPKVEFPVPGGSDFRAGYRVVYNRLDADVPLTVGFSIAVSAQEWSAVGLPPTPPPAFAWTGDWPPSRFGYEWTRKGVSWPDWSHRLVLGEKPLFEHSVRHEPGRQGSASMQSRCHLMGFGDVRWLGPGEMVLPKDMEEVSRYQAPDGTALKAPSSPVFDVVRSCVDLARSMLAGVRVVSTVRGAVLAHSDVGPDIMEVGLHGEMAIRMLSNIQVRSRPEFRPFQEWARKFGMPSVEPGWAGGSSLKVAFRDPWTGTVLESTDAASGCYQGLLLSAQLLLTERGSTILLEEPENNMHPRFEKLLPDLFAEAMKGGRQVVASTHSEVLVAALGNAVRKGVLKPSDVAVWHLERGAEGIGVQRIQISDRGYLDGWVKSFAAVEQELFDEWQAGLPEEGETSRGRHASARGVREGRGSKRK